MIMLAQPKADSGVAGDVDAGADVLLVGCVRRGLLEVIVGVEVHVGRAGHKPGQPPAAIRQGLHAPPLPTSRQAQSELRGGPTEGRPRRPPAWRPLPPWGGPGGAPPTPVH